LFTKPDQNRNRICIYSLKGSVASPFKGSPVHFIKRDTTF